MKHKEISGGSKHVLLVDDDTFNHKILTLLLELHGHKVVVATNGEVALQKLTEYTFDIIFMDMQMPVLDGLQTSEIIRDCEQKGIQSKIFEEWTGKKTNKLHDKHVPIVAITGNLDEESRRKCQQAGMDYFLAKPFTRESVDLILLEVTNSFGNSEPVPEKQDSGLLVDGDPLNIETDLPALGMAHLQKVYPLEKEQISQLLDESVRSLKQSIQEASQAVTQNNPATLASMAHKLKGTLMGLGLEAQVNLARDLELSAQKEGVTEYTSLFNQIKDSLKSLIEKDTS